MMMNSKAKQTDVDDLKLNKTNKIDSENQMKAIDILHKQNHHLIVLLIEIVKQLLMNHTSTYLEKQNKYTYIMDQCKHVCSWITHFDP